MRTEKGVWTTLDLELYHDAELDAARRAELSDALRRDPKLRERFAAVCRVDSELQAAFVSEPPALRASRRAVYPAIKAAALKPTLVAACLLVAVGLAWWVESLATTPQERFVSTHEPIHGSDGVARQEYRAIRVVLSLPVPDRDGQRVEDHDAKTVSSELADSPRDTEDLLLRLDRALMAGQIEDSLDVLDGAPAHQRVAAYRHLGAWLRSARVAERLLDQLSPKEQLVACSLWARRRVAQPTVFERLRRFSTEPALADDVHLIVAGLAADGGLRTWLRGYQLVGSEPTTRKLSG